MSEQPVLNHKSILMVKQSGEVCECGHGQKHHHNTGNEIICEGDTDCECTGYSRSVREG